MLKASFIADVATMPLHWWYDQAKLAEKVGDASPAFFSPPSVQWYSYPEGVFSPYGDESLPLMRSIVNQGEFKVEEASESMFQFFKDYPNPEITGYAGRLNHAPKGFAEARAENKPWAECAQDDDQANGLTKVPLIVARYAGDSQLHDKVKSMVGILQNNKLSVDSCVLYARVLEAVALNPQHPGVAIASVLSSADNLTPYEKNVLAFVNSDAKITEWVDFSDALNALELLPEESPYSRMGVKGAVLNALLASDALDLPATLQAVAATETPAGAVLKRFQAGAACADVREVELTVNQVAAAIGLSCALPGACFPHIYYLIYWLFLF